MKTQSTRGVALVLAFAGALADSIRHLQANIRLHVWNGNQSLRFMVCSTAWAPGSAPLSFRVTVAERMNQEMVIAGL